MNYIKEILEKYNEKIKDLPTCDHGYVEISNLDPMQSSAKYPVYTFALGFAVPYEVIEDGDEVQYITSKLEKTLRFLWKGIELHKNHDNQIYKRSDFEISTWINYEIGARYYSVYIRLADIPNDPENDKRNHVWNFVKGEGEQSYYLR